MRPLKPWKDQEKDKKGRKPKKKIDYCPYAHNPMEIDVIKQEVKRTNLEKTVKTST